MPITIGSNIISLNAQRKLEESSSALSRVFERFSSGQRINRASDDPAGLALSSSLNLDARVYTRGIQNLSDGLSLLAVAEGGVSELTGIVIRIKELAEQAANGIYTADQRTVLTIV